VAFVTILSVVKIPPRVAQKLARHTDLQLTMNVYTDAGMLAGAEAMETLPEFRAFDPAEGSNPVAPGCCTRMRRRGA